MPGRRRASVPLWWDLGPISHPRLRNGSFAHASRSDGQRNRPLAQTQHTDEPYFAPAASAQVLYSEINTPTKASLARPARLARTGRGVSPSSPPCSHRYRFCIAIARFSIQAGPGSFATQPARNVRARRDLCPRFYVAAIAYPHPPRAHAPRYHTQTGPPVSATRPSPVLFSPGALCARMCAIAPGAANSWPRGLRGGAAGAIMMEEYP